MTRHYVFDIIRVFKNARKGRDVSLKPKRLSSNWLKKLSPKKSKNNNDEVPHKSDLLKKAESLRKTFAHTDPQEDEATLQEFNFNPIDHTVEASEINENVTLDEVTPVETEVYEANETGLQDEIDDSSDHPVNKTRSPRTIKIGPTSEYDYFDDIVHLLVKGDTVQFEPGSHVILTSNLDIEDITLLGANTTNTLIDYVPREDGPLFNLASGSTLQVQSLTIRVAPKSRLAVYEDKARVILDSANVHWNHYKIQHHIDNLPLIAPADLNAILDSFIARDTYSHTLDIYAKQLSVRDSNIGDDDGLPGTLAGWADNWNNANLHNMHLALGGEIDKLTVLGRVLIEDIPIRFREPFPNLHLAPLNINNLLFGRVIPNSSADKALLGKGSITEKVSRFTKALSNDADTAIKLKKKYDNSKNLTEKEILTRDYELTNCKSNGATYITFDSYNLTADRRPIYNSGNLVLTGSTNESKSNWACIQAKGQLRFNEFQSEWLWAFESEDAKELSRFDAINSNWSDGSKKLPPLVPTPHKPTADVPRTQLPLELPEYKARYMDHINIWEDALINAEFKPETINIIVYKGISLDKIYEALRRRDHPVTMISKATIKGSHPKDKIPALVGKLDNTWVIEDLYTFNKDKDWRNSLLNMIYSKEYPTQLVLLTDVPSEATQFNLNFKQLLDINITTLKND